MFLERNQRAATACTVGGVSGSGAPQEAPAILFDLGLGQRIKIGDCGRP